MSPRAVVERYFECLNTESWGEFGEIWHGDAELRAVGARPRHGRQEILEFFGRLFDPWPQHLDEPTRIVVAGEVVTVEIEFRGRSRSGREATFAAVDVFDIEAGRIRRLSNWYDLDFVRRELTK
jgi:ketosteroid isomerase-like protein